MPRIKYEVEYEPVVHTLADVPDMWVYDGLDADVDGVIDIYQKHLGVEAYAARAKGPGVEEPEAALVLVASRNPIVLHVVINDVNSEAVQIGAQDALVRHLLKEYRYVIVYDEKHIDWARFRFRQLPQHPSCWCAGIDPLEAEQLLRQYRFTLPVVRPHVFPAP